MAEIIVHIKRLAFLKAQIHSEFENVPDIDTRDDLGEALNAIASAIKRLKVQQSLQQKEDGK